VPQPLVVLVKLQAAQQDHLALQRQEVVANKTVQGLVAIWVELHRSFVPDECVFLVLRRLEHLATQQGKYGCHLQVVRRNVSASVVFEVSAAFLPILALEEALRRQQLQTVVYTDYAPVLPQQVEHTPVLPVFEVTLRQGVQIVNLAMTQRDQLVCVEDRRRIQVFLEGLLH